MPGKEIYFNLLKLGFPVLVTELGVIMVAFADTMMVGAYGTNELAAASFVNNFFLMAVVMQVGFAAGITPLVGALYGKKKYSEIGKLSRVAVRMNLAAGVVFTTLMGVLYFFLDRMGQPSELMPLIKEYWLIILSSLLPLSLFNCLQQVANGTTDTATPMWVMLFMNVVNIIGNYILIFGKFGCPELGLAGAGYSTAFARWTGAVLIAALMLTRRRYHVYREGYALISDNRQLRKELFNTSWPVMLQSGLESMLWSLGAVVCGWFGALQLAGYQVIVTISQIGFMTYISFGIAGSIAVSNCMGKQDYAALRRGVTAALHVNLLLCLIASTTFISVGEYMLRMFTSDSGVIAVGMVLIPPLVLYQLADAIQITYAHALRGTSDTVPLLRASIVAYILFGVPLMLFLADTLQWKSIGVYYSFSGALFVAAWMLWRAYRRAVSRAETASLTNKNR